MTRSGDLQYVQAVARNIGRYMSDFKVFVDKTNMPVCRAEKVQAAIAKELASRCLSPPPAHTAI
jgi:UDPglucose 6-dehydrogenase